jgi:hypothetical protein
MARLSGRLPSHGRACVRCPDGEARNGERVCEACAAELAADRAHRERLWQITVDKMREQAPDFTVYIWFEPLHLGAIVDGRWYVVAPEHVRTWVTERYQPFIESAAGVPVEIVSEAYVPPLPAERRAQLAEREDKRAVAAGDGIDHDARLADPPPRRAPVDPALPPEPAPTIKRRPRA